jgi:hypothetical protein
MDYTVHTVALRKPPEKKRGVAARIINIPAAGGVLKAESTFSSGEYVIYMVLSLHGILHPEVSR